MRDKTVSLQPMIGIIDSQNEIVTSVSYLYHQFITN